jgi:hypothetical protein
MSNDGEDYADVDASASADAGAGDAGAPRKKRVDEECYADIPFDVGVPAAAAAGGPPGPPDPRDERVADDCFAPPKIACECYCLHCQRTFMSGEIWLQRVRNAQPGRLDGFWMCPTPNCDGKGFTFDIFPTDPDHPANEGWHYDDEDDDEAWEDEEAWEESAPSVSATDVEYDPDETKWKRLDEELGEDGDDDDIEGEEWKFGLSPGESLPQADWQSAGRRQREEDERRYNMPDERPREIEWEEPQFDDDDIPF